MSYTELMTFLAIFEKLGCKTVGEVDSALKNAVKSRKE